MTAILLKALLGAALLVCLFTAALFWTTAAGSLHWEHIRRCSGGRIWRWALSEAATCLGALTASALLYPAFLFKRFWLPEPGPGAPGPQVLFAHGVFHTASAWVLYARWFRRDGFGNLHAWTYPSFGTDFDTLLDRLEVRVQTLRERHPGSKVVLVGHSLGGLLIRAYLSRPGAGEAVAAAVAIGAPHQGSALAILGCAGLARELAYRGPLIRRLEAGQIPPPVPALSIYSPVDNMVVPPEGTRINCAGWEELETAPVSHVWLLYHRPAAAAALSFIAAALGRGSADSAAR